MSRYTIVPTRRVHLAEVANRLRAGDAEEFAAIGVSTPIGVRRALTAMWVDSTHCWTAYVDGEIALVGGCQGVRIAPVGHAWLVTTPAIERVPLAFAKEARRWLTEILAEKHQVLTSCLATYEKSARFWSMLGFAFDGETVMASGAVFRNMRMERA